MRSQPEKRGTDINSSAPGSEDPETPDFRSHASADKAVAALPRRERDDRDEELGALLQGRDARRSSGEWAPAAARTEDYRRYRTVRRTALSTSIAGFLGAMLTLAGNVLGLGVTLPSISIATLIISAALVLVAPLCLTAMEISSRRSRAEAAAERRVSDAESRLARLEARVSALSRHLDVV